jgi:hypothetical protein
MVNVVSVRIRRTMKMKEEDQAKISVLEGTYMALNEVLKRSEITRGDCIVLLESLKLDIMLNEGIIKIDGKVDIVNNKGGQ